jgi:hypothetical protein
VAPASVNQAAIPAGSVNFISGGRDPAAISSNACCAKRLASLGAILEWISIPAHLTAAADWTPVGTEGMIQTMTCGGGYGLSRSDLYSTSLMPPIEAGAIRRVRCPKSQRSKEDVGTGNEILVVIHG